MELISGESTGHLAFLLEESSELAKQEERNRLAREIHDTVAQGLTGIIWRLNEAESSSKGDREQLMASLVRTRNLAKECLQETRRFVWGLRSPALNSGGITEAIRQEVTRTREWGIRAAMSLEGLQPDSFDEGCETNVLRIAQEALSNVRHHARAKSVMVTLTFGPSEVMLRVKDDGIGFDPGAVHGVPSATGRGFGLSSMRERAGLVGGSLALRSASGMGTRIEACIPYQPRSRPGVTTHNKEASMTVQVE